MSLCNVDGLACNCQPDEDQPCTRGIEQRKELARLRAENATLQRRCDGLEKALRTIIAWGPFPDTGNFHEDGTPMSYSFCYGSNGQRDYMRDIAKAALAGETTK